MENSFQTSFIPKKLITSNLSDKEPKNFFAIITTFLLIASILISGGLFVYKLYLTKQQETLSSSLAKTRDSFEKATIDELELFDKRTQSAETILNKHLVFSPLFTLLGEITIPSIQYTKFDQKANADGGFLVNMEGVALDYRSIALQADVFNSTKGSPFKDVLFSDLIKDKDNHITFNLKFTVDPDLLSYEKNSLLESTNASNNQVTDVNQVPPTTDQIPTTTEPLSTDGGGQAH